MNIPRRRHERYEVGTGSKQAERRVIDAKIGAEIWEEGGAGDSDTLGTENDGAEGGTWIEARGRCGRREENACDGACVDRRRREIDIIPSGGEVFRYR